MDSIQATLIVQIDGNEPVKVMISQTPRPGESVMYALEAEDSMGQTWFRAYCIGIIPMGAHGGPVYLLTTDVPK